MSLTTIPGITYEFNLDQTVNSSVYPAQLKEEINANLNVLLLDIYVTNTKVYIRFTDNVDEPMLLSIIESHQGLDNIEKILEFNIDPDIEDYMIGIYYNARTQINSTFFQPRRPNNLNKAIDVIKQYSEAFISQATPKNNKLSVIITDMSRTKNYLERLTLWVLYRRTRDGIIE